MINHSIIKFFIHCMTLLAWVMFELKVTHSLNRSSNRGERSTQNSFIEPRSTIDPKLIHRTAENDRPNAHSSDNRVILNKWQSERAHSSIENKPRKTQSISDGENGSRSNNAFDRSRWPRDQSRRMTMNRSNKNPNVKRYIRRRKSSQDVDANWQMLRQHPIKKSSKENQAIKIYQQDAHIQAIKSFATILSVLHNKFHL